MMPSPIYNAGDVVVVPFPFTDNVKKAKRRPVVVVSEKSFNNATGQCVCAMITSSTETTWPQDVPIKHLESAGLSKPCFVRMKIFTLDQAFILRITGHLAKTDKAALQKALDKVIKAHD